MNGQGFAAGAVILMIANAVSKILGAVFKIPLTYILKEEGMAVYNSAFQIYILFLSFIISGIPFAVSKLVCEYRARGEKSMVSAVMSMAGLLLAILGALGSVILYFWSDFFAIAMREERAVFAIEMMAPSVFLVAVGCVYKHYFQGTGNMIPTAVSQVGESFIKLAAGYTLALWLSKGGAYRGAGGAALGVSVGEAAATAILFFMYLFIRKNREKSSGKEKREALGEIAKIAFPLLFASVISSMLSVVDTTLLRARLIDFGHSADEARFVYGAYTGYALTVFHLPVGILATLGVSILPLIAGSIAVKNKTKTVKAANLALKLTMLLSMPCAVGIYFLGEDILEALFHNTASAQMLIMCAPCVVFLCCSQISGSILQAAGRIVTAFICAAVPNVIKIALSYVLIEKYGIYGAVMSANIAYFIAMLLNIGVMGHVLGLKYAIGDIIIKPGIAAAVMGTVLFLVKEPLNMTLEGVYIRLIVNALLAGGAYVMTLFLTGGVSVKEIRKALAK